KRMAVELRLGKKSEQAEAACVVEIDGGAVLGCEHDMVVRTGRRRRRALNPHTARHAQMGEHDLAVVEMHQDIFCAPGDAVYAPTLEPGSQIDGQGDTQVGTACLDPGQAFPG